MATLLGKKINATYDSLLKTEDNDGITSSLKQITDGVGQTTPLYLSTTEAKIGGNLEITGDLTVGGTTTYVNTDNVTVKDGLVLLANNNTSDILDIGLYGKYNDGAVKYTGIYRDASDGVFKIFDGLTTEPTTTVGGGNLADFAAAGGSFTGNLTVSSAITAGYLTVADGVFHDGDTDTKIEFLANQIKTTTGGVLNINVVPTATTFYQNVFVDGNIYSTDGSISLTNGDIVTGGHITINSGNAATSFSSNANQLIVGGVDSGTHQGLTIGSYSGATGNIFFADGITGDEQYRGLITYNHSSDTMYLGASAANRLSITSSGLSVLSGGKIFVNGAGNNGYINSKGAVAVQVASIDDSRLFRGIDSSLSEVFYVQGTGDVYAKNNITSAAGNLITGYIGATTDVGISSLSDLVFGTMTASTITEKMRIDTAGNVGIGDTPDTLLHIKGSAPSFKIESSDTSGSLNIPAGSINFFGGYSDSIEIASIRSIDASSGGVAGQLAFYTSEDPDTPTERMRIDNLGNVGIGTNNPSGYGSTLVVNGTQTGIYVNNSGGTATIKMADAGVAEYSFTLPDGTGDFAISKGSSERMRIDSSGNLIFKGNDFDLNNGSVLHRITNSGTDLLIRADYGNNLANSTIQFSVDGSERMRIDSSGNVGIKLAGDTATATLDIVSDAGANGISIRTRNTSNDFAFLTFRSNDGSEILADVFAYRSSTNVGDLRFTTNNGGASGTERMRIDSSGNVTMYNNLYCSNIITNSGDLSIDSGGSGNNILFKYGGSERMRINSSGNLIFKGNDFDLNNGSVLHRITNSGTDLLIRADYGNNLANSTIQFSVDGSERMRIDSSGRVGISDGGIGLRASLNIESLDNAEAIAIFGRSTDSIGELNFFNNAGTTWYGRVDGRADGLGIWSQSGQPILFKAGASEKMRITSGGYLKASNNGSYGSASASYHEIRSNADDSYIARIDNTTTTNGGFAGLNIRYTSISPDANSNSFLVCEDSTTVRMRVYSDGDVWTSDAGTLTSDETLKRDITDASPKLDDIMKLRVRNYYWKEDYHPNKQDKKLIGFIAQEFEEVFPAMVSEHTIKDAEYETIEHPAIEATYETIEHEAELDEEGNVIKEAWTEEVELTPAQEAWTETTDVLISEEVRKKGIKEGKLIPILVKAMQEQQEIIQSQGDLIKDLTARVEALENK